jgi:hypothetical protein
MKSNSEVREGDFVHIYAESGDLIAARVVHETGHDWINVGHVFFGYDGQRILLTDDGGYGDQCQPEVLLAKEAFRIEVAGARLNIPETDYILHSGEVVTKEDLLNRIEGYNEDSCPELVVDADGNLTLMYCRPEVIEEYEDRVVKLPMDIKRRAQEKKEKLELKKTRMLEDLLNLEAQIDLLEF